MRKSGSGHKFSLKLIASPVKMEAHLLFTKLCVPEGGKWCRSEHLVK